MNGFFNGGALQVEERKAYVPHIDQSFRFLHISDTHLQNGDEPLLDDFVAKLKKIKNVDFVTIGGDIIGGKTSNELVYKFLDSLPSVPKIAILGNHDFQCSNMSLYITSLLTFGLTSKYKPADTDRLRGVLKDKDIILLEDDEYILNQGNKRVYFYGMRQPKPYVSHSAPQCDANQFNEKGILKILLVHRPDINAEIAKGFHLAAGGHTHGGQVALPFYGPLVTHCRVHRKNASGHFRIADTHWFVNNGFSASPPRLRIGAPRQVTIIEVCPGKMPEGIEELRCH